MLPITMKLATTSAFLLSLLSVMTVARLVSNTTSKTTWMNRLSAALKATRRSEDRFSRFSEFSFASASLPLKHSVKDAEPFLKGGAHSVRRREWGQDSTVNRQLALRSNTSDSAIKNLIQQCLRGDACSNERTDERSLLPELSSEEFDCCTGVVSALKMIYHGAENSTLYLPHAPVPGLSDAVNPCDQDANYEVASSVYFADCSRCFPKKNDKSLDDCDFEQDKTSTIQLQPGDSFCMVSFDLDIVQVSLEIKFPKYLPLFYQQDGNETIHRLELPSACSNPLYPPFGARLGSCGEDGSSLVNLLQGPDLDSAYLEFVDGVTTEEPTVLFTNCPLVASDNHCCRGGASFIKLNFVNSDSGGLLTLDATIAASFSPCIAGQVPAGVGNGFDSLEPFEVRFLHCDDPCLCPFSSTQCLCSYDALLVEPESDICIAMYDSDTGRVAFDEQLPANLQLYFVPYSSDSESMKTTIRTSCSDPLYPTFAQAFFVACNDTDAWPPFNLEAVGGTDLPPIYISFLDGISSDYFDVANSLGLNESSPFDISFAECGCGCNTPSAVPTSSTATSLGLSIEPSLSPSVSASLPTSDAISRITELPSIVPTEAPLPRGSKATKKGKKSKKTGVPTPKDCERKCEDWVYDNCVVVNDDGNVSSDPCVVEDTQDNEPRLLQQLQKLETLESSFDSADGQIDYHNKMIGVYVRVLEMIR